MRRIAATMAAVVLTALVIAACGDGNEGSATPTRSADTGDKGVKLEKLSGDFDQPVYVTQPPGEDSDLYVVVRTGKVEIVRDGKKLPKPFIDFSDKVKTNVEQGFLSIAFAPDYESSGLLYAYYTGDDGNQNVVELQRSASNPDMVDPSSEREVLKMDDYAANHNGGLLTFGPDGHLYIGTGDGGGHGDPQRNAQDLGSYLGKILRIDPRPKDGKPYSVPADNPFAGTTRPEVYAYGLRNPWRYSFDPESGNLIIGDVGQDEFEEIDVIPAERAAGANFGWSALEGDEPYNDDQSAPRSVKPALVYSHDDKKNGGCSVNGGYVVHDPGLPALGGRYVYSDFCSGQIRSFRLDGARAVDDRSTGLETDAPTSFGIDNAGHIYVTTLNGDVYMLTAK